MASLFFNRNITQLFIKRRKKTTTIASYGFFQSKSIGFPGAKKTLRGLTHFSGGLLGRHACRGLIPQTGISVCLSHRKKKSTAPCGEVTWNLPNVHLEKRKCIYKPSILDGFFGGGEIGNLTNRRKCWNKKTLNSQPLRSLMITILFLFQIVCDCIISIYTS